MLAYDREIRAFATNNFGGLSDPKLLHGIYKVLTGSFGCIIDC
jgi:hypothetical protein